MIGSPLYWFLITVIVISSQMMDALTTTWGLKNGYQEMNPAMKEHVIDPKRLFLVKLLFAGMLIVFLLLISFTNLNPERFLWLSASIVVISVVVAFLNPVTTLRYKISDALKGHQKPVG